MNYTLTIAIFLIISGIFFMLVKTWVMNQVMFIRNGHYTNRSKDYYWNWPGWAAVLVFVTILFLFILILKWK